MQEIKRDLLAFRKRFAAIDCPEGVEPWPCAEEVIAADDGGTREVKRFGRPVGSAAARLPVSALSGLSARLLLMARAFAACSQSSARDQPSRRLARAFRQRSRRRRAWRVLPSPPLGLIPGNRG